jgi:Trk K+ transport system NAD-binding subunit
MEQHFILCGLGRVGWRVLEYLRAAGAPVLVINNRPLPEDSRLADVPVLQGDCRRAEVLERAGLDRARGVLVLTSEDLVSISTALMVRHLNPNVRVVVRVFNENLIPRLGKAVANVFALSVANLTAPLLALTALTGNAMGTFGQEDDRRQVAELTVTNHSRLQGRTVAEVLAGRDTLALAHLPFHGPGRFLREVEPADRLEAGDRLVLCGPPRQLTQLLAQVSEEVPSHVLWAGWLRRMGRMAWRTFREIDLPVKICTAVLLGVVAVSALIYHFWVDLPLAHGLYRTISVMATGADMHEEELELAWQKVFVSGLRISGAALIAAFTAIVTNYLLRARLGGALEMRRIPDSGHVIVCGLGNIGYRVIEELLRHGERVVSIESRSESRFLNIARRMGVAVIVGDATVLEVLRQANAATARAVVAATDNDLANLEVALLARELNPKQRVVLRLTDTNLAKTLRQAADIKFALSIPALAAPAFVAALFGDRVQTVFLVEGRLQAVVDLVVQPGDEFLDGQSVRALAIDYQLVPVNLVAADKAVRQDPLNTRLAAGDRLTAIISLADLQRLLQRELLPREYAVEVTGCPPPARPWVAQLLRTTLGLSAEAAESSLEKVPLCLGTNLTRGQAEELMFLLNRERVPAQLRRLSV